MTIVEVKNLNKRYGDRTVVDGVDLAVRPGEIFGILGPNGAGKTTTVECIAGLRRPDGGSVRVDGLDPQRDGTALRRVLGAQLQESELPGKLRVGEALKLYSSFYRNPVDWRELAERLHLTGMITTPFRSLSGGQKQRLSIALALVGSAFNEAIDNVNSLAMPVRDATGAVVAALSISGPSQRFTAERMSEAIDVLGNAADTVTRRLGGTPVPRTSASIPQS